MSHHIVKLSKLLTTLTLLLLANLSNAAELDVTVSLEGFAYRSVADVKIVITYTNSTQETRYETIYTEGAIGPSESLWNPTVEPLSELGGLSAQEALVNPPPGVASVSVQFHLWTEVMTIYYETYLIPTGYEIATSNSWFSGSTVYYVFDDWDDTSTFVHEFYWD